jgi:hypothetical protein
VLLDAHIAWGVILHLGIASSTSVIVHIPIGSVQRWGIEIIFPYEGVWITRSTSGEEDGKENGVELCSVV